MLRPIKSKDLNNFLDFCQNKDPYSDFYIYENGKRNYLTDFTYAKVIFNRCLKRGDKCYIKVENGQIYGILIITGYALKEEKYVKVLYKTQKDLEDLFYYLSGKNFKNLFIRAKEKNKDLIYYNNHKKIYFSSHQTKIAGFQVHNKINRDIILTNKEYNCESK